MPDSFDKAETADQKLRSLLPQRTVIGPNVIGIGAINYDFIFEYEPDKEETRPLSPETGTEDLGDNQRDALVENRILDRISRSSDFIAEIGGSAYRAIQTISCMEAGLTTSYVGVYSLPRNVEQKAGLSFDPKVEFEHLSNTDWLFEEREEPPGRALVKLRHGLRGSIEIGPGSNTKLREKIIAQEALMARGDDSSLSLRKPFTEFLASGRWVHLTSFSDFEQFEFIVDRIRDAKTLNPALRFSIDPGDEYTRQHVDRLSAAFAVADYVFLSKTEFDNIKGGSDFPWRNRVDAVGKLVEKRLDVGTQVLVVKSANTHILLNYVQGRVLRRTFWHPRLWRLQICNDTGAGDVFAGGLIAGLLSPFLLSHQPAPIKLGATLSAIRLKSGQFPKMELKSAAWRFFESNQRNERDNFRQRIQLFWERNWPWVVSSIISFATGVLVALLFS